MGMYRYDSSVSGEYFPFHCGGFPTVDFLRLFNCDISSSIFKAMLVCLYWLSVISCKLMLIQDGNEQKLIQFYFLKTFIAHMYSYSRVKQYRGNS